jgi:hypothetical protein
VGQSNHPEHRQLIATKIVENRLVQPYSLRFFFFFLVCWVRKHGTDRMANLDFTDIDPDLLDVKDFDPSQLPAERSPFLDGAVPSLGPAPVSFAQFSVSGPFRDSVQGSLTVQPSVPHQFVSNLGISLEEIQRERGELSILREKMKSVRQGSQSCCLECSHDITGA